jgi:Flp pilus assembly protein TadG
VGNNQVFYSREGLKAALWWGGQKAVKTKEIVYNDKGVAAIEFALVLPVLVLLLIGIVEFSLLLYNKAMITNASREGARVGVVYDWQVHDPDDEDDDTFHPNDTAIISRVNQYLQDFLITFGASADPVITITRYEGDNPADVIGYTEEEAGDSLSVRVAWTYNFLVLPDLVSGIMGDIASRAVMRFE